MAEHSTTAYFTDYETYRLKKGDRVFITYNIDDYGDRWIFMLPIW